MGNWAELMLFLYRSGWIRKEKYPRVPVEVEWCGLSSVACKDPEIGMFRLCLGNATDSFLHIMSAWNKDTEAMDTVQPLSSDCLPRVDTSKVTVPRTYCYLDERSVLGIYILTLIKNVNLQQRTINRVVCVFNVPAFEGFYGPRVISEKFAKVHGD